MRIGLTSAELVAKSRQDYQAMQARAIEIELASREGRLEGYSATDAFEAGYFLGGALQLRYEKGKLKRLHRGKMRASVPRVVAMLKQVKQDFPNGNQKSWFPEVATRLEREYQVKVKPRTIGRRLKLAGAIGRKHPARSPKTIA